MISLFTIDMSEAKITHFVVFVYSAQLETKTIASENMKKIQKSVTHQKKRLYLLLPSFFNIAAKEAFRNPIFCICRPY